MNDSSEELNVVMGRGGDGEHVCGDEKVVRGGGEGLVRDKRPSCPRNSFCCSSYSSIMTRWSTLLILRYLRLSKRFVVIDYCSAASFLRQKVIHMQWLK